MIISNILSLIIDNIEQNRVVITEHYSLIIEKDCNGLIVYFILLATILAMNTTILCRVTWGIIGYISVTLVDIFRIYMITELVMIDRSNFYLAHKYIWKYTPIHNSYNGAINLFFQL